MKKVAILAKAPARTFAFMNKTPQYKIERGIRYVEPYFQTIKTTVKARWLNRKVLDILSSEFRNFTQAEYKNSIEKYEITIVHRKKLTKKERKSLKESGMKINDIERIHYPEILNYKIQDNDVIERIEHIHERAVLGVNSNDIEVIFDDEDLLVVNKPSGIPIHPVQNYYYNSFVQILQNEGWPGIKDDLSKVQLRPSFRLDKLTSGVCIFAKTNNTAKKIQMDIQNRKVEKVYLARVRGKFPGLEDSEEIECADDVIVLDTKKGKENGMMRKEARTIFKSIKYNKDLNESIVMCWPKTGRTHQIRIHLRNMKFPITNDPLYGKGGIMSFSNIDGIINDISDECFEKIKQNAIEKRISTESNEYCKVCGVKLYTQSNMKELTMYLHAFEYKSIDGGWAYKTKFPEWCNL